MTPVPLNEDSLLSKFRHLARSSRQPQAFGRHLIVGIGDDAALFRPKRGHDMILTCDWFLEGAHFLRDKHPPDSVGWKCLARALSDVAAMGGIPRCFLLSVALPVSRTGQWLDHFLRGLRRASRKFQCALAGGDTTRHGKILINVSVVGEVPRGHALLRSGARPGDSVFVSGCLGQAERGFQLLSQTRTASLQNPRLRKHLYPEPRLALGQFLASNRLVTAMMDLSDGLSSDLPRLCAASGVGASIASTEIPAPRASSHQGLRTANPLEPALHGGDDYELLFTVAAHSSRQLPASFLGLPLTRIGIITKRRRIVLLNRNGRQSSLVPGGWDPFRDSN